jgi:hypothetical protein
MMSHFLVGCGVTLSWLGGVRGVRCHTLTARPGCLGVACGSTTAAGGLFCRVWSTESKQN